MLGPAANHYITVSHASNFTWRESHFRDLIGLMGDGLLTIDGEFHRRSRLIMLPVFHREHIAASLEAIVQETTRALDELEPGTRIDLYAWTRRSGGSRGDARAVRRGPRRPAGALDRRGGPVRGGPRVLRQRVRAARPARARHAVGEAAAGRAQAGHADLLRDLQTPRDGRARTGHPQPAARRSRRGRQHAQRPADPRRGDDAAVRRPRHHHLDRVVHVLRARPPSTGPRAPVGRAGRGAPRSAGDADRRGAAAAAHRRAERARDGPRRDAAQVPARVGRATSRVSSHSSSKAAPCRRAHS